MRIFYASDTTPNSLFASNVWRNNLYLPLVDLGHDVIEFQYDLRDTFRHLDPADPEHAAFIERNRPIVSEALLRQIRTAHAARPIDVFFSYFYDACVLPEAIDAIKRLGIRTVNWYCNGSYQLHLVSEIAPHYDWCLVPERNRLNDYERLGARPIYCQEAANPNVYKPWDVPVEFDVTFVGQAYGDRPGFVRYLLDRGVDVRVWGVGWERYALTHPALNLISTVGKASKLFTRGGRRRLAGLLRRPSGPAPAARTVPWKRVGLPRAVIGGPLDDVQMVQMYSRSRINLGFSSCGDTHETRERILQIRLRDFEVPMSGGFYMVEYMEELEEFFKVGEEVICYRDREELADKIRYFLRHERERETVRRAGYERSRRDHTWHRRFETVFRQMGLG